MGSTRHFWQEIPTFTMAEAKAAASNLLSQELPVGNDRWVEQKHQVRPAPHLAHRRGNLTDLPSRCQTQRDLIGGRWTSTEPSALIGDMGHGKAEAPDGTGKVGYMGSGSFIALDLRASLRRQIDWLQRKKRVPVLRVHHYCTFSPNSVLESAQNGLWFDKIRCNR